MLIRALRKILFCMVLSVFLRQFTAECLFQWQAYNKVKFISVIKITTNINYMQTYVLLYPQYCIG